MVEMPPQWDMINFFFSWAHVSCALEEEKSGLDFSAFCLSRELPMSVLLPILAQIFPQVSHLHKTDGGFLQTFKLIYSKTSPNQPATF